MVICIHQNWYSQLSTNSFLYLIMGPSPQKCHPCFQVFSSQMLSLCFRSVFLVAVAIWKNISHLNRTENYFIITILEPLLLLLLLFDSSSSITLFIVWNYCIHCYVISMKCLYLFDVKDQVQSDGETWTSMSALSPLSVCSHQCLVSHCATKRSVGVARWAHSPASTLGVCLIAAIHPTGNIR